MALRDESDRQRGTARGRWHGRVLAIVVTLIALAVMWWGISGSSRKGPSDDRIVTTCTAELQRCRMGGPKLGLCGALPDGSLQCQSQH